MAVRVLFDASAWITRKQDGFYLRPVNGGLVKRLPSIGGLRITPDGKTSSYHLTRDESELYFAEGLH